MNRTAETIVDEICRLAPELEAQRAELMMLVEELRRKKPEVFMNEAFIQELRSRLMTEARAMSMERLTFIKFPSFFGMPMIVGGVLAVLLLIVALPFLGVQLPGRDPERLASVQNVGYEAFGSLHGSAGSLGGSLPKEDAAVRRESVVVPHALAPHSVVPEVDGGFGGGMGGGGGVVMPSPLIYPSITPLIRYEYEGALEGLEEEGLVYKRLTGSRAESISALRQMSLGLADLGTFSGAKVTNFTMEDASDLGYIIFVDLNRGSISINSSWKFLPVDLRNQASVANPKDIPDSAIITIADRFLDDHKISREGFGDPMVIRPQYQVMPMVAESREIAVGVPYEIVTVRYPQYVGGLPVYEQHGEPAGLTVNVNLHESRVQDVYGLELQSYQSSQYPLTTDTEKIRSIIRWGGFGFGAYPMVEEMESQRSVTVPLGDPVRGLVRYWRAVVSEARPDGWPVKGEWEADELLVPALIFPTKEPVTDPAKQWYIQRQIVVPLVPELLEFQPRG